MENDKLNRHKLPSVVFNWLQLFGAWLVGSGADWYIDKKIEMPKDLDIIISPNKFQDAMKLIRNQPVSLNSFGGVKVKLDGVEVDVWPMYLDDLICNVTKQGRQRAVKLAPYNVIEWTK